MVRDGCLSPSHQICIPARRREKQKVPNSQGFVCGVPLTASADSLLARIWSCGCIEHRGDCETQPCFLGCPYTQLKVRESFTKDKRKWMLGTITVFCHRKDVLIYNPVNITKRSHFPCFYQYCLSDYSHCKCIPSLIRKNTQSILK